MTTVVLRPIDHARAARLLLGWLRDDRLVIDTALNEAATDPIGPAGLIFGLTCVSAELAKVIAPEDAEQVVERVLIDIDSERRASGDA